MNVQVLYLSSGHTVVAQVDADDTGHVVLTRPLRVEIQVTQEGPAILPLPFGGVLASQLNDQRVTIGLNHVIARESADVQLEKFWMDVTSPIKSATPEQT